MSWLRLHQDWWHSADFNCKQPELGKDQTNFSGTRLITATQKKNNLTLINDDTLTHTNKFSKEDANDLIFISQQILPKFRDFLVEDDLGSDHLIINGVFSNTPIYNKKKEKTVRLFHKTDWIGINNVQQWLKPHLTKWPLLWTELTITLTHW